MYLVYNLHISLRQSQYSAFLFFFINLDISKIYVSNKIEEVYLLHLNKKYHLICHLIRINLPFGFKRKGFAASSLGAKNKIMSTTSYCNKGMY